VALDVPEAIPWPGPLAAHASEETRAIHRRMTTHANELLRRMFSEIRLDASMTPVAYGWRLPAEWIGPAE